MPRVRPAPPGAAPRKQDDHASVRSLVPGPLVAPDGVVREIAAKNPRVLCSSPSLLPYGCAPANPAAGMNGGRRKTYHLHPGVPMSPGRGRAIGPATPGQTQ